MTSIDTLNLLMNRIMTDESHTVVIPMDILDSLVTDSRYLHQILNLVERAKSD